MELESYRKLYLNTKNQISIYEENEKLYKLKHENYNLIISDYKELSKNNHKIYKYNKLENLGYFVLGIGLTVGSFYMVDKISDDITNTY